jgi:hypothetical protein
VEHQEEKAMTRRRWFTAAAVLLAAGGGIAAVSAAAATRGAASTIYSRTVYGPDFRPLDSRLAAQFAPNTGGGVFAVLTGELPPVRDFEAPVDLPVGANVTSVAFFYKDCFNSGGAHALYYFGSYQPSAGHFTYHLPEAAGDFGTCTTRYSFARTKATIATVQVDRRYVLGADVGTFTGPDNTSPDWILYGARIRYTCPITCT